MTTDLEQAALRLASVLGEENAALAATDLAKAGTFLQPKQQALDAFMAALAAPGLSPSPFLAELGRKLRSLAAENRSLLERAITVQGRVLSIVASAVPSPSAQGQYGSSGGMVQARGAKRPVALVLRA